MSLDTVTLDDAVKLLSLPRVVGTDPDDADGVEITAQNGRYGPYLKKGTDSRSLTSEDQLFTITLDEALKIYAQPKQRGRAAAAPPLKELGNDPVSGQPVVVKSGRFGEYVTDGEYNATLRKDDSVEAITLERAAELLAERRERGPAKKGGQEGRQEVAGQEDREEDGEEDGRQEDRREEDRARSRKPRRHGTDRVPRHVYRACTDETSSGCPRSLWWRGAWVGSRRRRAVSDVEGVVPVGLEVDRPLLSTATQRGRSSMRCTAAAARSSDASPRLRATWRCRRTRSRSRSR